MKFLFNEILLIFLLIFLIFISCDTRLSPGHTTPISLFFPNGTSTMSPGVNFSLLELYVNEKLIPWQQHLRFHILIVVEFLKMNWSLSTAKAASFIAVCWVA